MVVTPSMDLKWLFAESNVKLANYRLCKSFDTLGASSTGLKIVKVIQLAQ